MKVPKKVQSLAVSIVDSRIFKILTIVMLGYAAVIAAPSMYYNIYAKEGIPGVAKCAATSITDGVRPPHPQFRDFDCE